MYLADAITPRALLKPSRLARLMDLYETNYRRLLQLAPALADADGVHVSVVPDDMELYLSVQGQTRYTTRLRLTYYFPAEEQPAAESTAGRGGDRPRNEPDTEVPAGRGLVPDPDVEIRVFHDARLAEVLSCNGHPRHPALQAFNALAGEQVRRRWPRNLLLAKWLEFCLEHGHSFRGNNLI